MILGMTTFTFVHFVLSLVGIFSGFVVLFGLIAGKRLDGWTAFFLAATVATSVTGFGFPIHGFTPGIGIGIILPRQQRRSYTNPKRERGIRCVSLAGASG